MKLSERIQAAQANTQSLVPTVTATDPATSVLHLRDVQGAGGSDSPPVSMPHEQEEIFRSQQAGQEPAEKRLQPLLTHLEVHRARTQQPVDVFAALKQRAAEALF